MSTRLKPYPGYKDSGVKWFGRTPAHWEIHRLKHVASVQPSNVDKKSEDGESPVRLCNYVDVYYNDRITADLDFMRATATADEKRKFQLQVGDVCVTKDSEEWSDIAVPACVADEVPDLLCGYHLALVCPHPGRTHGEFLARAFAARGVNDQFRVEANGITRFALGQDALCNALFPVPPLDEQQAIAGFLDRETGKIDALVKKKERLIELLQEKRKALIGNAVTQGLNPNAPKKACGIPWLGLIPKHWELRRLRFLLLRIDQGWSPVCANYPSENGQWGVLKAGCANGGVFNPAENKTLPDGIEPPLEIEVRKGDVLMSRASGSTDLVGSVAIVREAPPSRLLLSDKTFRLVLRTNKVEPEFVVWTMGTPVLRHQISEVTSGAEGLASNIAKGNIYNLVLPLPPRQEQQQLCAHITGKSAKIDNLMAKVRTAIERLQEYRTALISAAVTGQIDVRREIA